MRTLHMLKSATDTICQSFIFESDGTLLVIDGGFESESETLFAALRELGGHVSGWIITHPHADHLGAFCRLMEDHGADIRVDALYCHFLSEELLCTHEPHEADNTRKYLAWTEELLRRHGIRRITPCRGDVYTFGGGQVHVLREPDPQITANCINNASLVFRLDTAEHRVLFLGDLGEEGGRQLLAQTPPEELHSDYVQMAHHGQNGVEKAVYEAIQPRCCLWCTPTWLWDKRNGRAPPLCEYERPACHCTVTRPKAHHQYSTFVPCPQGEQREKFRNIHTMSVRRMKHALTGIDSPHPP